MNYRLKRSAAYALYAVGAFLYIYYFLIEMDSSVIMYPFTRIVLFGSGSMCVYFASLFLGRTVDAHSAKLIMKSTFRTFFVLYILLLITFTLFDDVFGRATGDFIIWGNIPNWSEIKESINIIPFRTVRLYIRNIKNDIITVMDFAINIVGNICAFMPLSLFLPLLFPKLKSRGKFILTVSVVVLSIELMQLVSQRGSCDIDDLILNVSGAMLMYEILRTKPLQQLIHSITLQ
ncbi:MAG: VanZ family protein [Oscillospiraceae bacterium]